MAIRYTAGSATMDDSGRVGIGTTTPSYALDVSVDQNSDTDVAVVNTNSGTGAFAALRSVADSSAGQLSLISYSSGHTGSFAAGISNAKLKLVLDNSITANSNGLMLATSGSVPLYFATASAERMRIDASGKVGIGTTSPSSILHVVGGVQVGNPTGGDKGSGTINVSGDIYRNGTAYTNPDYVFEQAFDGVPVDGYRGLVPLDRLEGVLRSGHQLPGIGREPRGLFSRQDVLLEKLEEAYLYILQLAKRVELLETDARSRR